jgi:two-component system response regulator FixJ
MPSDAVVHVVDDDEAVRDSLAFLLRAAKLEVKTYDSAVTFLRHPPASGCVVTDGAADFFEKPFDDDALLAAVRTALSKDSESSKHNVERAEISDKLAGLSNRERQVLEGLVSGHANKIIAHNLGISPRTVEIYRANVMTKMQADSLSALVRMALLADDLS